jgi:hypothetical protein
VLPLGANRWARHRTHRERARKEHPCVADERHWKIHLPPYDPPAVGGPSTAVELRQDIRNLSSVAADASPDALADATADTESNCGAIANADAEPDDGSVIRSNACSLASTNAVAHGCADGKPNAVAHGCADGKPNPKPDPKPNPKPDPKPNPKPNPKPDAMHQQSVHATPGGPVPCLDQYVR